MDLTSFHSIHGSVHWKLTPGGVEVEGTGLERTSGAPTTITRIWETHRAAIEGAAERFLVPVEYILATIATESSGKVDATRQEPGYLSDKDTPHKVSAGCMQTLLSTASDMIGHPVTRAWLCKAENSIMAGTAYIRSQATATLLDGPVVFAAYNAGGVYRQMSPENRWKLRQYPIGTSEHCDRAIKWLNDAVVVTMGGYVTKRGWEWFLRSLRAKTI